MKKFSDISLKTKRIGFAILVIVIIIAVSVFIYFKTKVEGCYVLGQTDDMLNGFVWVLDSTSTSTNSVPFKPTSMADLKTKWKTGKIMIAAPINKAQVVTTTNAYPDYKYIAITAADGTTINTYYYMFSKTPPVEKKVSNSICSNYGFSDIKAGAKSDSWAVKGKKILAAISWYVYDLK